MMKSALLIALLSPLAMTNAALDACSTCVLNGASRILSASASGLQQMCSSNNTCPITQAHCGFVNAHPSFVTGYFVGSSLPLADASRACVLVGKCATINRQAILTALLEQTEIDHIQYDLIHTSALLDLWPSPSACNQNSLFDNDHSNADDHTDDQESSQVSIAQDLGNMGAADEPFNPRQKRCVQCTKRHIVRGISKSLAYVSKVCASHQNDGDFWTSRCNYVNNATNSQAIEGYLTGHFVPTTFAVGACLGNGQCSSVDELKDWHPVQPFAVRLGWNGF